eukprot:TRINITY_DN1576_c0_g1_i12.p1 TRINITY_DN1576_c0_g1~~TRINITY_DN1576_c0_g1_i12.p1  ORF type:complete len:169 (-),score=22.67 TRINITY_DN1576_c0_g1_i12:22-528(-)
MWRIFGDHMLKVLREHLPAFRPLEGKIGPLEEVLKKIHTPTDFDDYITSATHGYGTAHDCYRKTASAAVLCHITKPTLFVNSLDDPMIIHTVIPYEECRENANIILATSSCSGHLGFFRGWKLEQVNACVHSSGCASLHSTSYSASKLTITPNPKIIDPSTSFSLMIS